MPQLELLLLSLFSRVRLCATPWTAAYQASPPGSPVPSTPERSEGLQACYWEGPSELPERRSYSSAPQCRRLRRQGLDPWFGKIPWRRKWQPTAVFLPGNSQVSTTRRGTATPVHRPQRPAGSTQSSTRGLRPPEQLERPAGFPSSDPD